MSASRVFKKDKDLAPIVDVRVWDFLVALESEERSQAEKKRLEIQMWKGNVSKKETKRSGKIGDSKQR